MTLLTVLSAGTSTPSSTRLLADRLAGAARSALQQAGHDVEVATVELREHARALADATVTGVPGTELAAAQEQVRRADALVAVSPVFLASYSGLFKSFLDVLEPGTVAGTPVLLGATAGSVRHSLVPEHAMRPLFTYLHAPVVPTAVFAASADLADGEEDARLEARAARAAAELVGLVAAAAHQPAAPVRDHRTVSGRTVEEELADPTPFEELLGRR